MHEVAIEAREDGLVWLLNRSLDTLVVYYPVFGGRHEQQILEEAESMVFDAGAYPTEIYVGDVDVMLYPIVISGPSRFVIDFHKDSW